MAALEKDIQFLNEGFRLGKRLGLLIRSEGANQLYTTDFLAALFEEEGGDLFEVRKAVLGHLQQGGNPTPYDRIMATTLTSEAVDLVIDACTEPGEEPPGVCIGMVDDKFTETLFFDALRQFDTTYQRPKTQWWLRLRPLARMLAQPSEEFGSDIVAELDQS